MSRPLRLVAAGLVALVATALVGVASPAPSAIDGHDFVARLDAARRLAEAGATHPSRHGMDAVRRALGLPLDVVVAGGTVHVDRDPGLASLDGTSAGDFRKADDHISAMEDAATAALGTTEPDRGRIAAALRTSFQGITTKPSLLERVRHDAWLAILSLWQRLGRAVASVPLPRGLLVVLLLGALGAVVVVLVRRMRYVVPERKARKAAPSGASRPDWERLARDALARGDFAGAVRARYAGLLAALADRGVVPDSPSLTAGECRRAVAGELPDVYPVVATATTIFESVMYGREEATAGEVDTVASAERAVARR